jgi:hypothetical protein
MAQRIAASLAFVAAFGLASAAFAEVSSGPVPSQPSPSAYASPAPYAPPLADPANETVMMRKRRSDPAFNAGVALDAVGATSVLVGLVALVVAANDHVQSTTCDGDLHCKDPSTASPAVGLGFIGVGLVVAAVGIPLTVWGGHKVRRPFSLVPSPGGAGLVWRF